MSLRPLERRRLAARLCAAAICVLGLSPTLAAQDPGGIGQSDAAHVVEPATAPPLGAVFRALPNDLWRFISLDTAVVLAGGGAAATIVSVWDDDIVAELQESPQLNHAFSAGSRYGQFAVILGGSFAVYAIGRASGHSHTAVVGADLARAIIVSQAWTQAIKLTVHRERPDHSNHHSFPSAHASGGFAAAGVLARHYGWKAAIPAYAGAAYIAAARLHDNRHYLSDVTFGAAMGVASARTVMLKAGRYDLRVKPTPTPGGAALTVTLVPAGS
jgi:membrane-associated phospholipid phosphatase